MTPKKRIGEMLLEAGIIDETQLKAALGYQRQWGVRLGQALVDLKLATEADIVRALSLKFGFEVAKLDALEPYGHEQAMKLFPREFVVRNNVFPMWADTANVTVAMSDPTNLAIVDEIRFRTGRRVKVCIGGDHEIADAVKHQTQGDAPVEAIALDLDADPAVAGEAVFDPFGGGSNDALEAFFGGSAAAPPGVEDAPPPPDVRAAAPPPPPASRPAVVPARPGGAPAAEDARRPAQPAARPGAPAPRAPTAARPSTAPPPRAPAPPAPPNARPPAPSARLELELEERPGSDGRAAAPLEADAEELTPIDDGPQNEPILASELAPQDELVDADASRELTPRELAILESLDRLADGAPAEPEVVKPTQAMAAMIRLLIRKRIVSEQEFLEDLAKK
jgi:hypothetical protein